jgi:hypothetical protein
MKTSIVLVLMASAVAACGEGAPLEDGSCFIECQFYDRQIDRTYRAVYACDAGSQVRHEALCHDGAIHTCTEEYGGDGSLYQYGWVPGCEHCDEACAPAWYRECDSVQDPGCQWLD